jgi:cytosine/uracil/thiamine/allantoin permease
MNISTNNLNTFKILFLIKGILTLCISFIFIVYAGIGAFVGSIVEKTNSVNDLPFNPGDIFLIIGAVGFVFSVTIGTLTLLASKYIKELRNYNFIIVIAVINGLSGILGILLAVFYIIEVTKPNVKELFDNKARL